MPLRPGDRIERYVIDALLGQGGMGEVYRAHDERLQRSVALKILHADARGDASASMPVSAGASRMLREARAVAALEHPNVVAIYDVGEVTEPEALRGTMYLAMELIKGQTLRSYVGDARVTMKERLRWLADVARALGAAHAAGLVHRDVKPENVMIRDGGPVKVLDFGIAKRSVSAEVDVNSPTEGQSMPTLTGAGVVMGTPLYMAPEQLRGEAVDGRADQFAWAVVAYELIAGRLPWSKEGGAITLVSQILSSPPPPIDPEMGVPSGAHDAVIRALSKDREDRFATMAALLDAFEAPPSPLAQTVGFIPASGGKRPSIPSGAAPVVIVGEPQPPPSVPAEPPAPTTGRLATTTAPSAAAPPPSRRRKRAIAGAALAVAGVLAIAVVGTRELTKRRALVTSDANAGAPAATGCTSHRACAAEHGGEPYVCRASDHVCVAIASQDCKAMYEPADLTSDDTVWLGAMFPLKGRLADMGSKNMDAVDFARSEVAQAVDSLQGSSIGRKVRRVAVVGCDDSEDGKRAALHLVDDVGVPGILGFRHGQEVVDLAGSFLIDRGVVSVASLTSSPLITRLPQPSDEPRLVWRTSFNFDSLAEATATFVHEVLEPREQARHAARARVVLVRSGYVAGTAFADTFFRRLVFNGKSALENGHDYQEIVVEPDGGTPTEEVAKQIVQMAPTFIVDLNVGHALELANAVEKNLPRGVNPPTYVLVNSATTPLAPFIGASADRRHRVFAVSEVWSSTPNARFVIRYNQARHEELSRDLNPSSSYDAFYVLAYGGFALPLGSKVTGVALAKSFARLVGPGKTVDVGPTGVFDALSVLVSGGTVDLEGTASSLDFDLSTGEAPFDFALSCPSVDDAERATGEDVESGVVYRWKAKRTDGVLKCR